MADRLTLETMAELVGRIYEAAVDQTLWPAFLDRFAEAMGAAGTLLWVHDFESAAAHFDNDQTSFSAIARFDPDFVRSYAEHYSEVNVWARNEATLQEGTAVTSAMLYPDEKLPATEFYNDWLRPQRLHHAIGGIVVKHGPMAVKLSSLRAPAKGPYSEQELGFYRALIPHLRRAASLHRRLVVLKEAHDGPVRALDLLPIGVILLDQAGRALIVNRAADAILADRDGIRLNGVGELQIADSAVHRAMARLIFDVTRTAKRAGLSAGGALRVPRQWKPEPLFVLVSPLAGDDRRFGLSAAAAIFISDPGRATKTPERLLVSAFGFTNAEARLAAAIVGGTEVKEYALTNDISVHTARGYLKQVLSKSGVRRQSDFIRLVLTSPLLAGEPGEPLLRTSK